jgi:hypothetical protein
MLFDDTVTEREREREREGGFKIYFMLDFLRLHTKLKHFCHDFSKEIQLSVALLDYCIVLVVLSVLWKAV